MIKHSIFVLVLLLIVVGFVVGELNNKKVTLQTLSYPYNELEPIIDEATMKIHHSGHHQAYVNNLNIALETLKEESVVRKSNRVETLLANLHLLNSIDEATRKQVRNNGGGVVNHNLFFALLKKVDDNNKPSERLEQAMVKSFGSVENFIKQFNEHSMKVFGSGWVFLLKRIDSANPTQFDLVIKSFANQDNSYLNENYSANSKQVTVEEPILGLDVWEHAYYLKHQNRRLNYVSEWWKVLDWKKVEERLYKCHLDVEFIGNLDLTGISTCPKDEL